MEYHEMSKEWAALKIKPNRTIAENERMQDLEEALDYILEQSYLARG